MLIWIHKGPPHTHGTANVCIAFRLRESKPIEDIEVRWCAYETLVWGSLWKFTWWKLRSHGATCRKKNAMFQPSITAKNKHNGATVYIYIVYICFGPAIGRLALTSSGVIGLHRAELFMSELGIGWHREGIGRVHVGPSNKGNLRIQHDLTSERHREIMVEHCCIGKCF